MYIYSQIKTHEEYLGVVPELAARSHIDYCDKVIKDTIAKANISIKDIDAVAATAGPGLLGGLLVGLTTAKSISLAIKKPFVAINHLDGHALTPRLSHKLEFPYLIIFLGFIFLTPASNLFHILNAALTDICCPIIVLHKALKGSPLDCIEPSLLIKIIFFIIGSLSIK